MWKGPSCLPRLSNNYFVFKVSSRLIMWMSPKTRFHGLVCFYINTLAPSEASMHRWSTSSLTRTACSQCGVNNFHQCWLTVNQTSSELAQDPLPILYKSFYSRTRHQLTPNYVMLSMSCRKLKHKLIRALYEIWHISKRNILKEAIHVSLSKRKTEICISDLNATLQKKHVLAPNAIVSHQSVNHAIL